MRDSLVELCVERNRRERDLVFITADLGFSVVEPFADEFPELFFNVGVCEQNMIGMAAGIASEGLNVVTYTIGNFASFRCAEQWRNDVDYHEQAVLNVAVGAGVSYGALGYSHHTIQDFALMRSMPKTEILTPQNTKELGISFSDFLDNSSPKYLRLPKAELGMPSTRILDGLAQIKVGDSNTAVMLVGASACHKSSIHELAVQNNISIYSLYKSGICFRNELLKYFSDNYRTVFVVEDHLENCGIGCAFVEQMANVDRDVHVRSLGFIKEIVGAVGDENYLVEKYHQLSLIRNL